MRQKIPPSRLAQPQRVGFFGGTFDPVHSGHLKMARVAEKLARLDRIYFVPAQQPWHKQPVAASYPDRFAMLALALQGESRWQPLHIPAKPLRPTYSLEQITWLQERFPKSEIVSIMGADALATVPDWFRWRKLVQACDFVLFARDRVDMVSTIKRVFRVSVSDQVSERSLPSANRAFFYWRNLSSASSTKIKIAAGRTELMPTVSSYIERAGLYDLGVCGRK